VPIQGTTPDQSGSWGVCPRLRLDRPFRPPVDRLDGYTDRPGEQDVEEP
jgi:hypothetical protein